MTEHGTPADVETLTAFVLLVAEDGECWVEGHLTGGFSVNGGARLHQATLGEDSDLAIEISHSQTIRQVIDFGPSASVSRHVIHEDGRGVTMHLADGTKWRTIRLAGNGSVYMPTGARPVEQAVAPVVVAPEVPEQPVGDFPVIAPAIEAPAPVEAPALMPMPAPIEAPVDTPVTGTDG